jgi:hypothetical protein
MLGNPEVNLRFRRLRLTFIKAEADMKIAAPELDTEIIRFLEGRENPQDLIGIVQRFRSLADDASIKAALLRLNSEGLLEITPDWEFRRASGTAHQ